MVESLEGNWDRLGALVEREMERRAVPGVAVGILCRGETAARGFGVTSAEHPLPVTEETLFQIGSITKTFTATVIMQLAEMGKLDLNEPVRSYLPDFRVADEMASSQATLRHLLTHTAGWEGDFFHDTGTGEDAVSRYVADMAKLQQLAPTGAVWSYNNAGFSVAGCIIEKITGSSYQTAIRELLLDPMGMESCYFDPGEVMTRRFALGHSMSEEGVQIARPWTLPRSVHPQGGITCHIRDLLRYARFHLGDGTTEGGARLLSTESMTTMQSPQVTRWGDREAMGLAWFIDDFGKTRQISHSGGTNGQVSLLLLVPERDFAAAVLTNANGGAAITREVGRWALKAYLNIEREHPTALDASPEELSSYAGHYARPFSEMDLGMLAGKLIAQVTPKGGFPTEDLPPPPAPPPMSLALCERDRLLVLDGPQKHARLDVIRNADGSIGWIRAGGRIHVRLS